MEDLIRAIARAGNLDSVTIEFLAHPEPGDNQWRVKGLRRTATVEPEIFKKFGATNADLRNALIALATTVGEAW
jgi:hypothetical protein